MILNIQMEDTKSELNDINQELSNFSQEIEEENNAMTNFHNSESVSISNIVTKPKFSSSYILKRKNLDDSLDDYGIYDIVDENGYMEFLSILKKFLKQEYHKFIGKIYMHLRNSLKVLVERSIDSLQVKSFHKEIKIIEDDLYIKENNDNCLFNCFQKKKKRLELSHNFSFHLKEILDSCSDLKKGVKKIFSDDSFKEEFNCLRKESFESFLDTVLNNHKVIVKLKDDVDNYAEYLNLSILIEKQENKLKVQKKKLLDLEEYKTQNECIICMENERKVLFFPCLHFIACETCAFTKLINDCPACHKKIEKREYILS